MLLKNKIAVLTGCNKGIGKEILNLFSKNKAKIYACVRKTNDKFLQDIKILKKNNQNKIIPIEFDLNNEIEVKNAANQIIKSEKKIDIIVNNAGSIHTSIFQMTTSKVIREIFEVNFFSQSIFTQSLLKLMVKNNKGSILFISSSSAIDGNEGRSAYSSSKAAINTLAKILSRELGKFNIRVNTIAPGLTDTDMMRKNTPDNVLNEVISSISLKRVAKPEEIANVALLLSSDLMSYVTGQVIRVDGGM
jgi:3-oxoacyl-[acyl-carrier protein] reductase